MGTWAYSIEYETRKDGGDPEYGSTIVSAGDAFMAVNTFKDAYPGADIREMRRIRHD